MSCEIDIDAPHMHDYFCKDKLLEIEQTFKEAGINELDSISN
jgi:hypothetical protein